jgi:tetratricopeptide (TPR) repeat protein
MIITRIWHAMRGERRLPKSVQAFRRAQRFRDEGRLEKAAALVARGLVLDSRNIVGHLLAGSIHAMLRDMRKARASFERALALDPAHPRALLGLGRIALEEGDTAASVELLGRALARYPDFPEARALLDVARSLPASSAAASPRATEPSGIVTDRLRVPPECRETLLAQADATVIYAEPRGARTQEVATRVAKLSRLAAAMLDRAGLAGASHHAIIEGAAETTYLATDGELILTLSFGGDVKAATALAHLERVWDSSRTELARRLSPGRVA